MSDRPFVTSSCSNGPKIMLIQELQVIFFVNTVFSSDDFLRFWRFLLTEFLLSVWYIPFFSFSRFSIIKNSLSECDAVDKLASFYAAQKDFRGQSFDTISSSGGTGSIIHYKPKRGSDQKIGKCMYLLDAGAHYSCGTTDTTRTIHCGEPSEFEKECYTLVLQEMNFKNIFKISQYRS